MVIQNAMPGLAALRKWDLEFFATRYASTRVPIDGIRSGKSMELGAYIESLDSQSVRDGEGVALYMRNLMLFEKFPELRGDFRMPDIAQPNWLQSRFLGDYSGGSWRYWVELFLSGPGSRFPNVHIDPYFTHAWSLQISGRKHFWLWPSTAQERAEMLSGEKSWQYPRKLLPDTDLEGFMPGREALRVVLEPGDLAFIPAGYWHTTECSEASVTLGGNFVQACNWREFSQSYNRRNPTHSRRQAIARKAAALVSPQVLRWREKSAANNPIVRRT